MEKLRNLRSRFLASKVGKAVVSGASLAAGSALIVTHVSAADAATGVDYSQITTAVTNGCSSVQSNAMSAMATVAPYGIALFAAILIVHYAKKFFKKIAA